jgi:hypothetical protein
MAGSVAISMLRRASLEADPSITACETWLARRAEYEALTSRWQSLEDHLFRVHNWHRLSTPERAAIPEAAELAAINNRLDELQALNGDLIATLPAIPATTTQGLASKLAVAAACVPRDENEEAHDLIQGVLRDLRMIGQINNMPNNAS